MKRGGGGMCAGGAAAVLFLFFTAVRAAPARPADAFPLVAQAVRARKSLCFRARQAITMSSPNPGHGGANAVRIVADELQGGRRVRMTYRLPARAAGRVVVDDGRLMHQWERSRHLILVERSRAESANSQGRMLALLSRNYDCVRLSQATADGLACDMVRISPRPGHTGPSRLLWIERRHRAILRTEEFDPAGVRRYVSFFETFRFIRPPSPRLFALPVGDHICRIRQALRDQTDFHAARAAAALPGRLPGWLPDGYALLGCAAGGTGPRRCILLHYSDGLEMLSVLETPAWPAGTPPPPVHAGQRVWERNIPPLHVAVVGDDTLPQGLGQELLAALEPGAKPRRLPIHIPKHRSHRTR